MIRRGSQHPTVTPRSRWTIAVVIAAWLVYGGLFLSAPLPSLGTNEETGQPLRRSDLLTRLLYPEDLLRLWTEGATVGGLVSRVYLALGAAMLLAAIVGCGGEVVRLLGLAPERDGVLRFVVAASVGCNVLSLFTLALGLFGLLAVTGDAKAFSNWRLCQTGAILLFVAGFSVTAGWRWWERRSLPKLDASSPGGPYWNWLDGLLIPLSLVLLLGAILPPTDFDVREYHLQAPKEFFLHGQIGFLPHNVYANMPLGSEMLALAGMHFFFDWRSGALVGKLLLAMFVPLTALGLKTVGARWVSPWAGSVAAVAYLSTPWMLGVSLNGLIEGALAHFLFASLLLLLPIVFQPNAVIPARQLGLAGFLAGAAATTKYPGLLYAVVLLAIGLVALIRAGRFRAVTLFLLGAAIGCGPWYVKNACVTGNPTYPLLYSVFDGRTRTPENDEQWRRAHRPDGFAANDAARRIVDFAGRSEFAGPVLIPLAALAALDRKRRRPVLLLEAYTIAILACWWLLTHRIDRFWLPALPIVALLAAVGASVFNDVLWRRAVSAALCLATAWGLLVSTGGVFAYNRFLADLDVLWRDPQRVPAWYARLAVEVPAGGHVLAEGDAAVFDMIPRVRYHTAFDASPLGELVEGRTPRQIHERLAASNVSHVYVHWGEIDRYRSPGNYGFDPRITPALFARLVREGVLEPTWPEFRESGVEVYPVRRPVSDTGNN